MTHEGKISYDAGKIIFNCEIITLMFPFQKIFTMLIRTFSRPMLGYVKRKQQEKLGSKFAGIFVWLGRRSFAFEHWVNLRILKTVHRRQHAQYKTEVLLEKGVETFYEIMFYLIVLGLPFWELYRSSIAAVQKEEHLQKRIGNLQKKMEHINQKISKIVEYAKDKAKEQKERAQKKAANLAKISKMRDKLSIGTKMSVLGQRSTSEEQSIGQKIQEIFENAIEVVADQFQDALDQMEFPVGATQMEIAQPDAADSNIQSLQVGAEEASSDLMEQPAQLQLDTGEVSIQSPEIDLSAVEVQVPSQ